MMLSLPWKSVHHRLFQFFPCFFFCIKPCGTKEERLLFRKERHSVLQCRPLSVERAVPVVVPVLHWRCRLELPELLTEKKIKCLVAVLLHAFASISYLFGQHEDVSECPTRCVPKSKWCYTHTHTHRPHTTR